RPGRTGGPYVAHARSGWAQGRRKPSGGVTSQRTASFPPGGTVAGPDDPVRRAVQPGGTASVTRTSGAALPVPLVNTVVTGIGRSGRGRSGGSTASDAPAAFRDQACSSVTPT